MWRMIWSRVLQSTGHDPVLARKLIFSGSPHTNNNNDNNDNNNNNNNKKKKKKPMGVLAVCGWYGGVCWCVGGMGVFADVWVAWGYRWVCGWHGGVSGCRWYGV